MIRPNIVVRKTSDRDVPVDLARAIVKAGLGPEFHYAGNPELASAPLRIAVIGTRDPSPTSLACIEAIAGSLATAGAVIVSGAAYGTDMAAHRGALAQGRATVAVLPMGLQMGGTDRLASLLVGLGDDRLLLAVSPFATQQPPTRTTPVIRNRLIASMAHAVVIGEAQVASGTFHCVRFAREMGLPLFLLRDRQLPRDGHLEDVQQTLLREGAVAFTVDECWSPELARRIAASAIESRDRALAREQAQLSLFAEDLS